MLDNKLGIENDIEFVREEERLAKTHALELFEGGLLGAFGVSCGFKMNGETAGLLYAWAKHERSRIWERSMGKRPGRAD